MTELNPKSTCKEMIPNAYISTLMGLNFPKLNYAV